MTPTVEHQRNGFTLLTYRIGTAECGMDIRAVITPDKSEVRFILADDFGNERRITYSLYGHWQPWHYHTHTPETYECLDAWLAYATISDGALVVCVVSKREVWHAPIHRPHAVYCPAKCVLSVSGKGSGRVDTHYPKNSEELEKLTSAISEDALIRIGGSKIEPASNQNSLNFPQSLVATYCSGSRK